VYDPSPSVPTLHGDQGRPEQSREPSVVEGPPVSFRPRRKFQDRRWLHLTLFVLTLASTTLVGANQYWMFVTDLGRVPMDMTGLHWFLNGFWYSGTILLILGAHEFGHYIACRYYQVDASLPFFIPMPVVATGTLGAFIRIREPIPTKRMLFDIGIAGPLAGFAFAVPALIVGLMLSKVAPIPDLESLPDNVLMMQLGEPLLVKAAQWLTLGSVPSGYSVDMHPIAFAAWFGLLATALNLFPIGQLDGGHISYAVLGRRSTAITLASIGVAIGLTFLSVSWMVWTFLLVAMTLMMGPRHPRTMDEDVPLDRTRIWLAALALLVFVLCFTPNPIEPTQLLSR
jgi:membrane-associated protease RseP (regulator of RpoE activity)